MINTVTEYSEGDSTVKGGSSFCAHYTRRDIVIALVLALIVFFIAGGQLTRGVPYWGDDSAAYVTEGIAIAKGELDKQAQLNLYLHPTALPQDATAEAGLVYVWGFPLLLSLVYKLVGFDTVNYSGIIFYKIPSLVCLALTAGLFFLLLRRRFSQKTATVAALVFCLSSTFIDRLNILYADICFLFAMVLALLLIEMFLSAETSPSIGLGIVLGCSLWFAYEVRLSGIALCLTAAAAQLIWLTASRERRRPLNLLRHLIPYIVFIILRLVSEHFLMSATSDMSSVGGGSLKQLVTLFAYYGYMTLDFLNSLTGFRLFIGMLFVIPAVIGFVKDGFRRENLHLTLLFLGTYVIILTMPYRQRHYIYTALPTLAIYIVFGCRRISAWWKAHAKNHSRQKQLTRVLVCTLLGCVLLHSALACWQNISSDRTPDENEMYSAQAVDVYHYIARNVPEDAVIACAKPRMLYLNTGRMTFRNGFNGHELMDADYYLFIHGDGVMDQNLVTDSNRQGFEQIYATQDMTLYRILHNQR